MSRSIPTYVITVPERHGRTDGRTDGQTSYCGITALCVASRGKKTAVCHISMQLIMDGMEYAHISMATYTTLQMF